MDAISRFPGEGYHDQRSGILGLQKQVVRLFLHPESVWGLASALGLVYEQVRPCMFRQCGIEICIEMVNGEGCPVLSRASLHAESCVMTTRCTVSQKQNNKREQIFVSYPRPRSISGSSAENQRINFCERQWEIMYGSSTRIALDITMCRIVLIPGSNRTPSLPNKGKSELLIPCTSYSPCRWNEPATGPNASGTHTAHPAAVGRQRRWLSSLSSSLPGRSGTLCPNLLLRGKSVRMYVHA